MHRRKPAHYFPASEFPLLFHIMTGPMKPPEKTLEARVPGKQPEGAQKLQTLKYTRIENSSASGHPISRK
jgi:hypothetical protein